MYLVRRTRPRSIVSLQPVEHLLREHALHRRMLAVLECIAERVECGDRFPAADVAMALTYFREFLDRVHHGKESEVLFPAVVMSGGDETAESIGALLADHDTNKLLLHSLTLFWEPGDLLPAERHGFADLVRTYAQRLRRGMHREESELFPLVLELPGDDCEQLLDDLERAGTGHRPMGFWLAEAARLESRYAG